MRTDDTSAGPEGSGDQPREKVFVIRLDSNPGPGENFSYKLTIHTSVSI
jgi:hypothetical protein